MPVPNIQSITPDDRQRNCPKHVDFRTGINLEISAYFCFIVKKFVTMHGHMNVRPNILFNYLILLAFQRTCMCAVV